MKAAVCSLARTLAMEVSAEGVNVNALVLGTYPTDINIAKKTDLEEGMGHDAGSRYVEQMETNSAVGRLGIPREVEGLVQLLATDAGSFITGQSIAVDGGMSSMIWANPPVKDPVIPKYCSQDI
jgi:NAD(P)-dependent dehydrogenase (short-subunit alcohol dehydrogenase family)